MIENIGTIKAMRKFKALVFIVFLIMPLQGLVAGDNLTLGLKAHFLGTYTTPYIGKEDMDYLGAQFMRGMVGFIMTGEAELTYAFDAVHYFNYQTNALFSGLGLSFNLGIGQGFSGQISGQYNELLNKDIEVYCRVYMTPVVTFGSALKVLFLQKRIAVGFGIGGRMLADPQPTYELYTNLTEEEAKLLYNDGKGPDFYPETGTLFIPTSMMQKMNPLGLTLKTSVEYCQPVISRMNITIGSYLSYTIYKPGYISMPKKVAKAAIENGKLKGITVDFEKYKLKSFYMNDFSFGISLGLLFTV